MDSVWAAGDARTDIREMGYCYNDVKNVFHTTQNESPPLISSDFIRHHYSITHDIFLK